MPRSPGEPAPVLVTGSVRSGTTWVGRMLCLSRQLGYVHEPFNPSRWPGWASERFPHELVYINLDNEAKYDPILRDVINMRFPLAHHVWEIRDARHLWRVSRDWQRSLRYSLHGYQPLLKDPDALFSAEWLSRRFDMQVVVLIRHPAGFASSVKRLNWPLLPSPWVWQEALMRDHLSPFADELHGFKSRTDTDVIDQAVLTWKCLYHVVRNYQEAHPEWHFVRLEDLAEDPQQRFRELYGQLGLRWDDRVSAGVEKYSASANATEVPPSRFRTIKRDSRAATSTWSSRLNEEEVDRIHAGVGAVGTYFYSDAEWGPMFDLFRAQR
jgi:hypothetical protein